MMRRLYEENMAICTYNEEELNTMEVWSYDKRKERIKNWDWIYERFCQAVQDPYQLSDPPFDHAAQTVRVVEIGGNRKRAREHSASTIPYYSSVGFLIYLPTLQSPRVSALEDPPTVPQVCLTPKESRASSV
ncbi:hypothetical protein MPER_04935 [Moniliophthora perniciosa FA553]|nr:hypothetical protein MPER_04935 [Moniliophthora perniciosa FA553]